MPTGYTAQIESGKITNAKDFLRICLRNFGICYSIRDDVSVSETDLLPYIKEAAQKEIDYYRNALEKSESELADFDRLTDDQIFERWKTSRIEHRTDYLTYHAEAVKKNAVYDKFLDSINKWNASHDFQNIKRFAIEQIEKSKDSKPEYWLEMADKYPEPTREEFEKNKKEICESMRGHYVRSVDFDREQLANRRKDMETLVDFYTRFEDDIKDIL